MKATVVPAQVTTVEDRIAGNLGLSQLLLLSLPVFGGSGLYIILPPFMHPVLYKLVIIVVFFLVCSLMAIRIRGKILLFWLIIIARYNVRPRYYVFNKNAVAGREHFEHRVADDYTEITAPEPAKKAIPKPLAIPDIMRLQNLLDNPAANLTFETAKGGLRVRITEVKE